MFTVASAPSTRRVLHLAFFVLVLSTAARMLTLDNAMCKYLLTLTALLAAGYAVSARRSVWLLPTLAVWATLLLISPSDLATAFAWSAVPLACLALEVLGPRRAVIAAAVVSVLVGLVLIRHAGRFSPDLVVAPVAAVWATLGLYRVQQRDLAARQRLVEELHRTRAELARQQHEAGMTAERARIARDLHDTLAQELAGGRMLLQAADRDWYRDPEQSHARVRAVLDTLGDNILTTRRIIADLTPPDLDDQDLPAALRALCARAEQAGPARVRFHADGTVDDPEPAAALLRVAQGALANVRDHAYAGTVDVILDHLDGAARLTVRDDGVGFTPDRPSAAPGRGFGLAAMRARLREYGGTVTISSGPGRGTTVVATLPLTRAASAQLAAA
jgi:signal transduction histidine kinase